MRKQILIGLALVSLIFPKIVLAIDEKELKFGFYADRMIVSSQTILFNEALNERINEIGNRVAKASEGSDMKYTFRIINDPAINAYAAAGGFIYVNTGLLDVLESEDELAAVLGHEIAHVNKSHQINFTYAAHRSKVAGGVVGNVSGVLLWNVLGGVGSAIGDMVGNMMAVSMIEGYGKKRELEADVLAVQYTKKAGYDPYAFISVLKKFMSIRDRLEISEKKSYASHLINAEPGLEERIRNAEELILKAE